MAVTPAAFGAGLGLVELLVDCGVRFRIEVTCDECRRRHIMQLLHEVRHLARLALAYCLGRIALRWTRYCKLKAIRWEERRWECYLRVARIVSKVLTCRQVCCEHVDWTNRVIDTHKKDMTGEELKGWLARYVERTVQQEDILDILLRDWVLHDWVPAQDEFLVSALKEGALVKRDGRVGAIDDLLVPADIRLKIIFNEF